ncbi:hypothetical protein GN244_ATG06575 [Phytophthora infestans]|uniref:Uncharacterized protein n=1 Tax=Phytophthora infestans TaxID=4787 RepID=A0A833WGT6_PHYIN|nr:hypothetical protein GN244_ATG06575 [Phytophthora infestans]KAF4141551.1 hypothetical protein GN958_ATG09256 [Phytophthora infestans]
MMFGRSQEKHNEGSLLKVRELPRINMLWRGPHAFLHWIRGHETAYCTSAEETLLQRGYLAHRRKAQTIVLASKTEQLAGVRILRN